MSSPHTPGEENNAMVPSCNDREDDDDLPDEEGKLAESLIVPDHHIGKMKMSVSTERLSQVGEKPLKGPVMERETWDRKIDFLLSVVGFAVDLGNVVRFPYVCFRNGGGVFLVAYLVMLIFGGLPLFYMELALGQYQNCGCITLWKRICPMFKGIGFGILFIASYTAMYYNTIIAWAMYYFIMSFGPEVPWIGCDRDWSSDNCTSSADIMTGKFANNESAFPKGTVFDTEDYFFRHVLQSQDHTIKNVGAPRWPIVLCLCAVFTVVYFALWKGVKSVGKSSFWVSIFSLQFIYMLSAVFGTLGNAGGSTAVWITATLPYVILIVLLIRGVTLQGAAQGIEFYLSFELEKLANHKVWVDAAGQIFFSLGPGFGVLLALSSYNRFHNNCYRDALVTASINCCTSFLAGFVVFSTLGYMATRANVKVEEVAKEGPSLVFIAYPLAIGTMDYAPVFSVLFFAMMMTLGIDSTFGGLEAMTTAICDEWQIFRRHRELTVLGLLIFLFLCALSTTTNGGIYVVTMLDSYGAPVSILFIVFLEACAVSWFYGVDRFSSNIREMIGHEPGIFWRWCWKFISPVFLFVTFISACFNFLSAPPQAFDGTTLPGWVVPIGICIVCSSVSCVPIYIVYRFFRQSGTFSQRISGMIVPEEIPVHVDDDEEDSEIRQPVVNAV